MVRSFCLILGRDKAAFLGVRKELVCIWHLVDRIRIISDLKIGRQLRAFLCIDLDMFTKFRVRMVRDWLGDYEAD